MPVAVNRVSAPYVDEFTEFTFVFLQGERVA